MQMGLIGNAKLNLAQDNETRWNSTYKMLKRILEVKPALIATIAIRELDQFSLRATDWTLMEKVVRSLESFEKATRYLSSKTAHIGCSIPVVTAIIEGML